jgi:hypothetical protein
MERRRKQAAQGKETGRKPLLLAGIFLFLVVPVACARSETAPPPRPMDAGQVAGSAARASTLDGPYRLVFEWTLNEPGTRLSGRGVARVEPPSRARLDLFMGNGERVAAAALVRDDLTTPRDMRAGLPPAPLLWGALGIFRPGDNAGLRGGSWQSNGGAELRYFYEGSDELRYGLRNNRIERMEVFRGNRASEEVQLVRVDDERFPREATYRHLGEVRELRITLETVEHVESYPSDIWNLDF